MKKIVLVLIMCSLQPAIAATMEEQVKGAQAVGALCKAYAEEIGLDSSHFSELNFQTLRIAEKLGYTDDFEEYTRDVSGLQRVLNDRLMAQYDSTEKIYIDWCKRFYLAFKKRANGG